ncbi:MAG: UDP-N-acetylmuramate--L-alanine ligase [Saprospiraceae bacterium]|nr:UDP-N-acetylmuramate--L-alanine ligase [Saprospiraceae bacterium]
MDFNQIHRIYFIGIGGIGMSALARYFHLHGKEVHGYDRTETDLTRALVAEGMKVHYTDDVSYIPQGVDLVVFTPAVPKEHTELNWFLTHGYPVKKRAEVLGIISKAKRCVAIAGTHGKTTTSTMTAYLMRACGIDASAFLGGISGNLGSNFVEGKSNWVVAEADEYDRSFLHLHPEIAVINSIDADHLDIYGSEEGVRESYQTFAGQVKAGGNLLLEQNVDLESVGALKFGIEQGDFHAENIRIEHGFMVFDLRIQVNKLPQVLTGLKLPYPGLHNVKNAVAAIACTLLAGGDADRIPAALASFKGVKRRFEVIVNTGKTVYVDDYAHHPAELEATISAARMMYPGKKLTGVFQPHLFTRTRDFADGFAAALDLLDECLLMPIYPARELPIEGVNAEMLLEKMQLKNKQLVPKNQVLEFLENHQPEVLLTMGAGDIDTLIEPIKAYLTNQ